MLKEAESDEKVDADVELKSSLSRPSASVGAISPDTLSRVVGLSEREKPINLLLLGDNVTQGGVCDVSQRRFLIFKSRFEDSVCYDCRVMRLGVLMIVVVISEMDQARQSSFASCTA